MKLRSMRLKREWGFSQEEMVDWKQEWAARSTQPNLYALWDLETVE